MWPSGLFEGVFSHMAVWAISDLYLSGSSPGRIETIARNWDSQVGWDDVVLIPGGFSVAANARQTRADLGWLAARPGFKVVGRGYLDSWWDLYEGKPPRGITLLDGFSVVKGVVVVLLSGFRVDMVDQLDGDDQDDYEEELLQLDLALRYAEEEGYPAVVGLSVPPMTNAEKNAYSDYLEEFRVPLCVYGQYNGGGPLPEVRRVRYQPVTADHIGLTPVKLSFARSRPGLWLV